MEKVEWTEGEREAAIDHLAYVRGLCPEDMHERHYAVLHQLQMALTKVEKSLLQAQIERDEYRLNAEAEARVRRDFFGRLQKAEKERDELRVNTQSVIASLGPYSAKVEQLQKEIQEARELVNELSKRWQFPQRFADESIEAQHALLTLLEEFDLRNPSEAVGGGE